MVQAVAEFDVGDEIEFRVTFTNGDGDLVDPNTDVRFRMQPPAGGTLIDEIYNGGAGNVTRESLGVFTYLHVIAASGVHTYRWEGTGSNVNAATADKQFLARTSIFT